MKKAASNFTCSACGHTAAKWSGQCGGCGVWNTMHEEIHDAALAGCIPKNRFASLATRAPSMAITEVEDTAIVRLGCGLAEFDRVVGGGVVPASIGLLGGDPGIGKSTLALQVLDGIARQGYRTLYITGEESAAQVAMRARRMGLGNTATRVQAETLLEYILQELETTRPDVAVVDSIQTVYSAAISSAPGSVTQVRECAAHLTRLCKRIGTKIILIGHVTKEGELAGPNMLMHMVDWVADLSSEPSSMYRLLRATKNRFGAVNELGVFSMQTSGMRCVTNPSAIFLSSHQEPVAGTSVMATLEGTRPMLVEVQALLDSAGASPRRLTLGLERDRLSMLLAVLNRHGGLQTSDQDVFVNAVGGVKIVEPASDIAVLLAIQSSLRGKALPKGMVSFGEVGLAGEVRPAPRGQERLQEAAKLGFSIAIVPAANKPKREIEGLQVIPVHRIDQALEAVRAL